MRLIQVIPNPTTGASTTPLTRVSLPGSGGATGRLVVRLMLRRHNRGILEAAEIQGKAIGMARDATRTGSFVWLQHDHQDTNS